ncbi:SDR family oxidoreductase [Sporichthya sp.]|uniref:SDR family NAD(P)-dependent oxidoreductase n=1 Tax=Sporichthya sp. TaxID=65475 RepID=UPI00184887D4|nr:SDR family oxidoreductase [Sporichthya sp.]MBA3741874.1 SDR family oxidoreductase [Sporichthya sp.]
MPDFSGRTAVVTGGGRGIGASICRELAAGGAAVYVVDRDAEPAEAVAAEIGGKALALDVCDADAVEAALIPLNADILVNNAGFDEHCWFTDATPAYWRRLIAVNLEGVFACTHAVLKGMQERSYGRLVHVSSEAGRIGSKGNAVYSAAKGGVIVFSKSIALENARFAITSNTILPGPIDTPLLDQVRAHPKGEEMIAAMKKLTPLGRLGTPEEIAHAVAFLCSEQAAYITGETLGVSGGMGIGA